MHVWPQDGLKDTDPRPRPSFDDYKAAAQHAGVELLGRPPVVGEIYLAGRNTGLKLLTAKKINPRNWVEAEEFAYPYDTHECIAVKAI